MTQKKDEQKPRQVNRRNVLTHAAAALAGAASVRFLPNGEVAQKRQFPSFSPETIFTPALSAVQEGSEVEKNTKFALQRELVVTSGDELLATGGLSTCDAVFLVGQKSGIRAVAHLDLHNNPQDVQKVVASQIEQLTKLFPPDDKILLHIKKGAWGLSRHILAREGKIDRGTFEQPFVEQLTAAIKSELLYYPNIRLDGVSTITSFQEIGNACALDKDGRLYDTSDISFAPDISETRLRDKSARVASSDTTLKVAFDGRTEEQIEAIEKAWKNLAEKSKI